MKEGKIRSGNKYCTTGSILSRHFGNGLKDVLKNLPLPVKRFTPEEIKKLEETMKFLKVK